MDPGKTLRLDVEMNLEKVTAQGKELKRTLSEIPGTASAGKKDAAHQREVNEAAARQEQIQKKNADALKKTGAGVKDVGLMFAALETQAKKGRVVITGMAKDMADVDKKTKQVVRSSSDLELSITRLRRKYGQEYDAISKNVAKFREQGKVVAYLTGLQRALDSATKSRLAAEESESKEIKAQVPLLKQIEEKRRLIRDHANATAKAVEREAVSERRAAKAAVDREQRRANRAGRKAETENRQGASAQERYYSARSRQERKGVLMARDLEKRLYDEAFGPIAAKRSERSAARTLRAKQERQGTLMAQDLERRMYAEQRSRETATIDRRVARIAGRTEETGTGVGARANTIRAQIGAVRSYNRVRAQSVRLEEILDTAQKAYLRSKQREDRLESRIEQAKLRGNARRVDVLNDALRLQRANTKEMRAELDLTKKTVAERVKFLKQGWWARQTSPEAKGPMANVARGVQHFGGYAIGAYQRTAGGIATGMRVYWSFLSVFYLLRNALELSLGPLKMFTGALKALVSAAIGAVRDMINIAGKTETLEKRLTSFSGIGPGITSWIVGQAVGKPFEWTSIGEAFQRAMAMGSPGEGFTKGTLMPVAYDLASSFMTDENRGTILRDAVMAIMQGASGNFQRLIRSFGFRPEQALLEGAVRGAGGRGVSGDPKNLQTNLTAILNMIEKRVGGTSDAISDTMTALLSDMEDVRNGLSMAFGDTQLFKDIKSILMGLRGAYIKLRDTGTIEEWFGYLDRSFKELMPLVQEALPYATIGLRTAIYLLGQVGESLTRMFTPFKGQVGERVNRVLATVEVAFKHFIESMESILPRVLVVFETWISASFKLARMVGNALLLVTDLFLSLVKKITFGGADATVREIEAGIQKVRDELFIGKKDPTTGKRDASTSVMGVSQRALDEFLTGIKGGYNPEIDAAMERNRQIAAGIPKAVQQGAESGVQKGLGGLAYANSVQSSTGFGEGDVGGSYGTGGIGGSYSMGGVGGSLGISGTSAFIIRKQLGAKYGPMYDAIQRMKSTSAIGRVRGSFEQAHANALQNASMLEQQLSAARESGDKEATDATQKKLRAEREYIALLEKSVAVLDQRTRALEKSQKVKGSGLFERMAGMIGGGGSDAGEVAAFSASVQEMARRNQQEAAWAAWVEQTGSAPLRAKMGALSNLAGTIGSGLRGIGFSPPGYSGNRQSVVGWVGKQYTMEEVLTPAQREDRKQAVRRAQEMERARKHARSGATGRIATAATTAVALWPIVRGFAGANALEAESWAAAGISPSSGVGAVSGRDITASALSRIKSGIGSASKALSLLSPTNRKAAISALEIANFYNNGYVVEEALASGANPVRVLNALRESIKTTTYTNHVTGELIRQTERFSPDLFKSIMTGGRASGASVGAWKAGMAARGTVQRGYQSAAKFGKKLGYAGALIGAVTLPGSVREQYMDEYMQATTGRHLDGTPVGGAWSEIGRGLWGAGGVGLSGAAIGAPFGGGLIGGLGGYALGVGARLTGGIAGQVSAHSASSKTNTVSDSSGNINIETVNRYSIPVGAVMNEQQQRDYSSINGALGPG